MKSTSSSISSPNMPTNTKTTTPKPQPRRIIPALIGTATTILVCIFWIRYVNYHLATAHLTPGPDHWLETARTKAYGLCYNGCDDCLDVGSIEKACQMTARANISGVICDASKMWTWVDRYPPACLHAVGEIYKEKAMWWKKFWYRSLYVLTLLGLPVGYLSYFSTAWILEQVPVSSSPASTQRPRQRRSSKGSSSTTPLLTTATLSILLLASLPPPASAYACRLYNPAHNQLFANADGTLYGVIHGWLSDCYEDHYSCGESCTASPEHRCSTIYCTQLRTDAGPVDFVRKAARYVTDCGFRLVDVVPGIVDRRIANPRIEGNLWVKVAVNRFNGSEGVDELVRCLYDMVPVPG